MDNPSFFADTMAVVGLGLIGGSFVKAMRHAGAAHRIVGFDTSAKARTHAEASGDLDVCTKTLESAVATADLIVLATPVRATLVLIKAIAPALQHGAKVIDLCSTKRAIVAAMGKLPPYVEAVGGHPMAGKSESGWGVAEGALFQNATFVLCPTARLTTLEGGWAESLVRAIGAVPLILDAAAHDAYVARISHLPYIVSATLAKTAAPDAIVRRLSAGSYRDTSRVAGHNLTMMRDILLTNADNMLPLIQQAKQHLETLEAALASGDADALTQWMQDAREKQ